VKALITPPRELLARFRWYTLLANFVNAALLLPNLLRENAAGRPLQAAAGVALAGLLWWWVRAYRRGGIPRAGYLCEGFALFVLGVGLADPMPSIYLLYSGVYFRTYYEPRRRAYLGGLAYLAGHLGAAALASDPAAPGVFSQSVMLQAPGIAISVSVLHILTLTLKRHELATARERILAWTGAALMAAPDREAIYRVALDAIRDLVGPLPGMLVAILVGSAEEVTVAAATGEGAAAVQGLRFDPRTLPLSIHTPSDHRTFEVAGVRVAELLNHTGLDLARGTVLVCPLFIRDAFRGAIVVMSSGALPEGFRETLEPAGAAVGLALEGAALKQDLQRSEARFRSLVQNSSDVVTVVDATGVIRYVSPAITGVMGHRPEDLIGRLGLGFIHPDDLDIARREMIGILQHPGDRRTIELRARHTDGSWRWMDVVATNLLDDPNVAGIVCNYRDITDSKAFREQLSYQAFHDPLTHLPNRVMFREGLEIALARAARHKSMVAVLFLDLDRFKVVNDSLGHETGDRLLVAVSRRLRSCLRPGDTFARLGGDEFTILLEDVAGASDAARIAERLIEALQEPFTLDTREVVIGGSIGIAIGPAGQYSAEELLRHADMAMYRAKDRGRSRYEIFDTDLGARARRRLDLEAELRRAVEHEEFQLHYQPLVSLHTGDVTVLEALVRWQHPKRGLILPAEFISLAEETGLIVPIGRWVLVEACRRVRQWQDRLPTGQSLFISVNVSARQFQQLGLVEDVVFALESSGLNPRGLILEITETVLMEDAEAAISTLHTLKSLGVRLALDDFGTGYSSLSYLRRYPIDILKIDRSFVDGLATGSEASSFVHTITRLAQRLRMTTVAEGIERPEQRAEALALGCDLGQGDLFSHPLDAEALEVALSATFTRRP
jgi:diguanylate cyclase (GGDEF)-like protein/PAS domain S-box-containing protein